MNPEFIARMVELVKKHGDRVVLADTATEKAVVILGLEEYEALRAGAPVKVGTAAAVALAERPVPIQWVEPQVEAPPAPPLTHRPAPEPAPTLAPEPVLKTSTETIRKSPPELDPPAALSKSHNGPLPVPKNFAKNSDNPFRKRAEQLGVNPPLDSMDLADLTQTELLDKINREIDDWKTAQERQRTDELQSAARRPTPSVAAPAVEEEERFYLEPIE